MTATRVLCAWTLGGPSGWGVYGLNLAQQWAGDAEVYPIFAEAPSFTLSDPLRAARLSGILKDSAQVAELFASGRPMVFRGVVLRALGNGLTCGSAGRINANAELAATFFEDTL